MKLLLLPIFFALVSYQLHAKTDCTINTAHKIYLTSKLDTITADDLIVHSTCSSRVNSSFKNIIINAKGSILSDNLSNILQNENANILVKIIPNNITISHLEEQLRSVFDLTDSRSFKKTHFLNKNRTLLTSKKERVIFNCNNCRTLGKKSIRLKITDLTTKSHRTLWIKAVLTIKTKVLVAVQHIGITNQPLSQRLFKFDFVDSINPSRFFTNHQQIMFYKVNKAINQNIPLNFSDLSPVNLIKSGTPAKVILQHGTIHLQGIAIPTRNGKFGDVVQLYHPKTRKPIIGRVIDFNKVQVEL